MNTAREIRNIWDEIGRMKTRTAGSASGAVKTFLGLNDTPAAYAGAALQNVRVNAAANALEFAAGGDVTGPGASTDTALARFHLATGKIIQNSNAILNDAGLLFLADTANTKMTIGITVNQLGNDDEIAAYKSSDVAHGATNWSETDTFLCIRKHAAATGGGQFRGLSSGTVGVAFQALYTNDTTAFAGEGGVQLEAFKISGAGITNAHADQVILSIKTYIGGGFLGIWGVNASGNVWQTGSLGINTAVPTAWLHLPAGIATHPPLKFTAGTALATPEAGSVEYHDGRFYLTNVATQRAIDRSSDTIISTTTVTNTTVETTVWTGTLAANSLMAGNIIMIRIYGEVTNTTAADDLDLSLYLGATLLGTIGAAIGKVAGDPWHILCSLTVRTAGAGGTISSHCDIDVAGFETHDNIESSVIDTTGASDVTVKMTWDNAKVGNIFKCTQGFLSKKN